MTLRRFSADHYPITSSAVASKFCLVPLSRPRRKTNDTVDHDVDVALTQPIDGQGSYVGPADPGRIEGSEARTHWWNNPGRRAGFGYSAAKLIAQYGHRGNMSKWVSDLRDGARNGMPLTCTSAG